MEWEQLPGESGQAFRAFKQYLELGPTRSYDEAYRQAQPGRKPGARAPGTWRDWAKLHRWQERARAFDSRNEKAADQARVTTIRQLAQDDAVEDWDNGRIGRQQQQEQEEWEFRKMLLDKAKLMLNFGLAQHVEKTSGTHGEVKINVYEPVKWDMGDAINMVKLAHMLGRLSSQMSLKPPDRTPPPETVPDDMFWDQPGQMSEKVPAGVMPEMPINPASKPESGAHTTKASDVDLLQPSRARPGT